MADDRLDSALELLSVVVETYPNRARVHRLLGDVLLGKEQSQPALDAYGRAAELDPHAPAVHTHSSPAPVSPLSVRGETGSLALSAIRYPDG